MKNKLWLKYLIYIILIIALAYLDEYVVRQSSIYSSQEYQINAFLVILPIFIKIGMGLLLGFDCFITQFKKEGSWKVNIHKIILMVIPSLYLGLATFIYYGNIPVISLPLEIVFKNSNLYMNFTSVFQLIFGYLIITSFYKLENKI